MTAKILDGAAMALEVEKELKQRVEALRERGVVPGLCVILVGSDPASQTYVAFWCSCPCPLGWTSIRRWRSSARKRTWTVSMR